MAAALLLAPAALAGDPEDTFLKAYYLEKEQGDLQAALDLYRSVASDASAPKGLRTEAERKGRACAEELACSDFARLVPADTLFYAELNSPGDQLETLLDHLGLVTGSEGSGRFAISPRLVQGLAGVRGGALAITGVDPRGGPPSGVVVLHPGDIDVLRGLIETALPAGGEAIGDIGGYPSWSIQGQAFVTATERLVVASTERAEIEGVIARLHGDRRDSLATSPQLTRTMAMRGEDLIFMCLNPEPIMPMIQGLIDSQVGDDPRVSMALSLLDLESMRALAARIGVDESGLSVNLGLELDAGHRNIAFNLMRKPHIADRSLRMIPEGVAFFSVSTLNERAKVAPAATDGRGEPVVTLMDFGRELFGNVVDVAIFGLPSISAGPGGQPMPDVALALTVNDPARSRALWDLVLGLAKGATGSGRAEPGTTSIAGESVERFEIQGLGVHLYTHGDRMVISTSERAIAAAVTSAKGGRSVLDDGVFAAALADLGEAHTAIMAVSAGRLAEIAKVVMPERQLREIGPYLALVSESVISATVEHSETTLGLSARVSGLPKVGGVLSERLVQVMHGADPWGARRAMARNARSAAADASEEGQELRENFEVLVRGGRIDKARELLSVIAWRYSSDARRLNDLAWGLLTEERYGHRFDGQALEMALRANELTGNANWPYLDTLGHAYFCAGQIDKAVEAQTRAVEAAGDSQRAGEARAALARFKKAASGREEIH